MGFSKGFKNELETAVVNEPSVFEPLKFYCKHIINDQQHLSHPVRKWMTQTYLSWYQEPVFPASIPGLPIYFRFSFWFEKTVIGESMCT